MNALKRIDFQRKQETRQNGGEDCTTSFHFQAKEKKESRFKRKVILGRIFFSLCLLASSSLLYTLQKPAG